MYRNTTTCRRVLAVLFLLCIFFLPIQDVVFAQGTPTTVTMTADDFIITGGKATGLTPGTAARIRGNHIIIDNIAGLTQIGSLVFDGVELRDVTIGAGITDIESNAFRNKGITKVTFQNNTVNLGAYAFEGNKISEITGSGTFGTIGASAFYNNDLSTLNITVNTVGPRAFAGNSLTDVTLHGVTSVGNVAFDDNPALTKLTVDTQDPPANLFAAGAFGTAAKTPVVEVVIDNNANNVVSNEPSVYLINPVKLMIHSRDITNGGVLIDSKTEVLAPGAIPPSYNAPDLPGYTIETNPVPIDSSTMVDRTIVIDVNYIKIGRPRIVVEPSKQLLFPQTQPTMTTADILQNVSFYDGQGNQITPLSGNVLDPRITLTPTTIPAANTPRTVDVNIVLKNKRDSDLAPGEQNLTATANFTFTFQNTNISDDEIIPGKGWKYSDFTYSGTTITGLSANGVTRLATNPDMVLPGVNPTTGAPITVIGGNAFQNRAINTVDFEKMSRLEQISNYAFSNSGINALLNMDKASELKSFGYASFLSNNIQTLDFQSFPKLERIHGAAFQNNKIEAVNLSNLQNLSVIAETVFKNNAVNSLSIGNNPKLTAIGTEAFRDNQLESVSLQDLPLLNYIGNSAFYNNQIKNVEIRNNPELQRINSSSFTNNQIESLSISGLPKLRTIDQAFNNNKLSSLELTDLPELEYLSGFYNNQIAVLTLQNLPKLKTIESNAFSNNKITELDLSGLPSLERIGSYAFNQNQIQSLQLDGLPKLKTIETSAFSNNKVESLVLRNLPELTAINAFSSNPMLNEVVLEGLPKLTTVSGFSGSAITTLVLKDLPALTNIGPAAFYYNKIKDLTLENLPALKRIDSNAFGTNQIEGTLNLSDFPLLEMIDSNAFSNNKLQAVNFNNLDQLKIIGNSAFSGNQLEKVSLVDLPKLEVVYASAFNHQNNGQSLRKVEIKDNPNLRELGGFENNFNLKNVTLQNLPALKQIISTAFYDNMQDGKLDLSQFTNLTTIAPRAYYASSYASIRNDISQLVLPSSITDIGEQAFYNNKINDLDFSHLSNLKSIGNYAFNTGDSNNRVVVADTVKLPATAAPINLGREIAHIRPDTLDFSSTPGVKVNLLNAKPFSVVGGEPLVMRFQNTDQVTWPSNIAGLEPNNPTILYIDNYDGSLNPPPGILINPVKLTIKHLLKADNSEVQPNTQSTRYIAADTPIDSLSFPGLRATDVRVTPNTGDSFDAATRRANIKYSPNNREKTVEFLYEPVNQIPTNDYVVTINRTVNTAESFHHTTRLNVEANFKLQNIPAGETRGQLVVELPPHTTDVPSRIVFPPDIPGVTLTKPGYYDPLTRRVIYEVASFATNQLEANIRVQFEFDRLDTPQRINEKAKAYYLLDTGGVKGNIAESQNFKPWYYERSAGKYVSEGQSNNIYRYPSPGSGGKYTEFSIPYEFVFSSERRLEKTVFEDTLPTYEKWDPATNSYVTAVASFDPAKNPHWTLSPDGTKAIMTLEKDVLETYLHGSKDYYLQSYLIRHILPKLTLDFPMAKMGQTVTNQSSINTHVDDPQAEDVPIRTHANTVSHTIWESAPTAGSIVSKTNAGDYYVFGGTGDENAEYRWMITVRSNNAVVSNGTEDLTYPRTLKNIEIWDFAMDGHNLADKLLEFKALAPSHNAKVYLYANNFPGYTNPPLINNTSNRKPNVDSFTLINGPITLNANQKYSLSSTERSTVYAVRVVYEGLTLTGPNEFATLNVISGNRNGDPFPKREKNLSNSGTVFADGEIAGIPNYSEQIVGNVWDHKYLRVPKPVMQATKSANISNNGNVTNRAQEIIYTIGYNSYYKGYNINFGQTFYTPDFKQVDVIPSYLYIKEIIPTQEFLEHGGTIEQTMGADGANLVTFRMPQAPSGGKTIARIVTGIHPSTPGDAIVRNRTYIDFTETATDPAFQGEHMNPAATPEEGGKQLTTAVHNISLVFNDSLTGVKYVRKLQGNGAWTNNIITAPGEEYEYKLELVNNLLSDSHDIDIFDLFPFDNDRYTVADGSGNHLLRGSEFEPTLVSVESVQLIKGTTTTDVSANFPITYFNTREGFPTNRALHGTTKQWIDAALADPSKQTADPTQAKAIHMGGTAASDVPGNSKLVIVLRMKNPALSYMDSAQWDDTKAQNTFAYRLASYANYVESNRVSNTLDAPKKSVMFKKVDRDTGEALVGARFKLEQNGKTYYAVSNSAGMLYFHNIEYMPYTVTEVSVPNGYKLDPTPIVVNLNMQSYLDEIADPNYVEPITEVRNEKIIPPALLKQYTIRVLKKNNTNNLASVRFELETLATGTKQVQSTNTSGIAAFDPVIDGQYQLKELSNLNRFTLIDPLLFELPLSQDYINNSAHTITEVVDPANPNNVTYQFEIQNNTYDLNLTKIGIRHLVSVGGSSVYTPDTRPDTQIALNEGTKLPNVQFEVYLTNKLSDGTTTADPPEEQLYTVTTNIAGVAKLTGLIPNRIYRIKEINTPANYTKAEDVEIYVDGTGKAFNANGEAYLRADNMLISNKEIVKRSNMEITKVDINNNERLQGVVFKLYKQNPQNGQYEAVATNGEQTTNTNGVVLFQDLEYGHYRVLEHKALGGYVSTGEPIEFQVLPYTSNVFRRTVNNKKFSIDVLKVERIEGPFGSNALAQTRLTELTNSGVDTTDYIVAENHIYKRLKGAEFELYENYRENGVDKTDLVAPDVTPAATDYTRYVYSTGLKEYGSYILKETVTPAGYRRISDQYMKIDLLVDYNNPTNTFYVKNERQTGQIVVTKYDSRDQNILPDAEFKVYAGHHEEADLAALTALDTQVTDNNGIARFLNLDLGDYTIVESRAPHGYQRIAGTTKITLTTAVSVARRTFYNRLAVTTLKIRKVDDQGNPITNLNNSEFKLYYDGTFHSNGENSATEQGVIRFANVPLVGSYRIVETLPPDNYSIIGNGELTFTHTDANPLQMDETLNPIRDMKNKELINIQAQKSWSGGNQNNRPNVYFKLYRRSASVAEEALANVPVTLVGKTDATVTMGTELSPGNFMKFEKYYHKADGTTELYTYYVKEVDAAGQPLDMASFNYTVGGAGTLSLTNTYRSPLVNLTVTKQWTGGSTVTKPNLIFKLYRKIASDANYSEVLDNNGVGIFLSVPTTSGNQVVFTGLPKTDANENLYTYQVVELKNNATPLDSTILFKPEGGASKSIAADEANPTLAYNNIYESNAISIEANKVWVGGPAVKPTVYFKLYRKIASDPTAVEVANSLLQVPANNTVSWPNVPATDEEGRVYTYSVIETDSSGTDASPPNYTKQENGLTVTNTYVSPKVQKTLRKVWNLLSGEAEPNQVVVRITRTVNGVADTAFSQNESVSAADGWTKVVNNLDATDANGVPYVYAVEEIATQGYNVSYADDGSTYTITNTQKTIAKPVRKVWVNDTATPNPTSVTVNLMRNGVRVGQIVLSASNNWQHTFSNLPQYDNTQTEYVYTFEEAPLTGYTTAIDNSTGVITNSIRKSELEVTKTWVDQSGNLDKPTSITVRLYQNGTLLTSAQLTEQGDPNVWTHIFTNLPIYDANGRPYDYTVDEVVPAGYQSVVNNYSITNTRILTLVPVAKSWVGNEGMYPDQITYRLYRDGTEIGSKVITQAEATANGNWNHQFQTDSNGNRLPKVNPTTAADYVYTIDEDAINGYDIEVNGNQITNTRKQHSITVNKEWVGGHHSTVATILLKRRVVIGGVEQEDTAFIRSFTATRHNRSRTFQLPEFDLNGNQYIYYIEEPTVPENYTLSISGLTATNTYHPPTTNILSTKVWVGRSINLPTIYFKLYRAYWGENIKYEVPTPIQRVNPVTNTVLWTNIETHDANGNPFYFVVREVDSIGRDMTPWGFEKEEVGVNVINRTIESLTPKTGDSVNIWLYILLALSSGSSLIFLFNRKKQK